MYMYVANTTKLFPNILKMTIIKLKRECIEVYLEISSLKQKHEQLKKPNKKTIKLQDTVTT